MKKAIGRTIPSIDALVVFDACVKAMNFTLAGNALGLTQSAVSRQIIDLERFLGVPLFGRSGRNLTLSAAGSRYWGQIVPLLRQLEAATTEMQIAGKLPTSINLSVAASFCNRWLIPRLPRFLEMHPRSLVNLTSRVGSINLLATQFDAAIVNAPTPPPDVAYRHLFPLNLAAYASPKFRTNGDAFEGTDIASLPLLNITNMPDAWELYLRSMGVEHSGIESAGSYDLWLLSCEAAVAGLGAALLPPELVTEDVEIGRLFRLSETEIPRGSSYWVIWRERDTDKPTLNVFLEWLGQLCPAS